MDVNYPPQGDSKGAGSSEEQRDSILNAVERLSLVPAVDVESQPSLSSAQVTPKKPSSHHATSGPAKQSPRPQANRISSNTSVGQRDRSSLPPLSRKSSRISLNEAATPPRSPAARRSSSYNLTSSILAKSDPPPPIQATTAAITSGTIAREFLAKDLSRHQSLFEKGRRANTVVILQDDCYGHRFSRPRTSKAGLSSIVERPERIRAAVLGVSAAYIRLGGRHKDGEAALHPDRDVGSLPIVPFDIFKTSRKLSLRSAATTAVHDAAWMNELVTLCETAESKMVVGGKELVRTHPAGPDANAAVTSKTKLHEGDLYLCSGSLQALEGALGGVCEAVDAVFAKNHCRRAFVCIRPPGHHCSADLPSGFCWLNNVHVGISYAAATHNLTHAAIIDFDLHHGDGSQAITWAHNSRVGKLPKATSMSKKTSIGYFSLHDINSYPCEAGDDEKVRNASVCIENAHGQSIWNVHLQPWKTEAEFWTLYEAKYLAVLEKARNYLRTYGTRLRQVNSNSKPRAAIFLSAGFDASEWESPFMQRHKVNVPTSFYARFTQDVVHMAEEEDLGVEGRVISVLEGGYSDRALMSGVLSHICGMTDFRHSDASAPLAADTDGNSLNTAFQQRTSTFSDNATDGIPSSWWLPPCLDEIEEEVSPKSAPVPPKKQRADTKPTYTSATQSYKAKVVAPPPGRRSLSGSLLGQQAAPEPDLPPLPAPEVGWTTASIELSKLLIPTDRPTHSHKPEDLTAEATRARRDRLSGNEQSLGGLVEEESQVQLREKRPRQRRQAVEGPEKLPSRASRRRTMADAKVTLSEAASPPIEADLQRPQGRTTRRRSSVASSAASTATEAGSEYSLSSVAESQLSQDLPRRAKPAAASDPMAKSALKPQKPWATPAITSNTNPSAGKLIQETATSSAQEPNQGQTAGMDKAVVADLDQLASGMKKMSIKLKVPTKEEHDAREKAKAMSTAKTAPNKVSSVKAARTTSPKKTKSKAAKSTKKDKQQSPSLNNDSISTEDAMDVDASTAASTGAFESGLPSSLPGNAQKMAAPDEETTTSNEEGTSSEGQTHGPADRLSQSHSEQNAQYALPSANAEPPNTSGHSTPRKDAPLGTPITVRRTKNDLPIFTPTSPITFGAKPSVQGPPSIDQTIDTIRTTNSLAPRSSNDRISPTQNPDKTGMSSSTDQDTKSKPAEGESSIWEVPDTPQRK